jgi:hypothetical protein
MTAFPDNIRDRLAQVKIMVCDRPVGDAILYRNQWLCKDLHSNTLGIGTLDLVQGQWFAERGNKIVGTRVAQRA